MARNHTTYYRDQIRAGMSEDIARRMISAAYAEGIISLGEKRSLFKYLTGWVLKHRRIEATKPQRKITLRGGIGNSLFDEETIREAQRLAKEDNND